MPRTCDWCREPIGFFDAQITSSASAWHMRCWHEAATLRAEYIAEREDCEGFRYRPLPDELPMSETGVCRSEVIPTMATAANAPNHRTPREVVEFPNDVPVTVALKYPQARTVSSQYGERFMFSLADGRIMFLDPEVGHKISSLAINVGENFTITRKRDAQKGPATATWDVARVTGEQPNGTLVLAASPKPPASADVATNGTHRSANQSLVAEAQGLVDVYAAVAEYARSVYRGQIKSAEVRAFVSTAYIQRGRSAA